MAFALLNGTMAFTLYMALSRENKRRDEKYGKVPVDDHIQDFDSVEYKRRWGLDGMTRAQIVELGDDHPAYRYML